VVKLSHAEHNTYQLVNAHELFEEISSSMLIGDRLHSYTFELIKQSLDNLSASLSCSNDSLSCWMMFDHKFNLLMHLFNFDEARPLLQFSFPVIEHWWFSNLHNALENPKVLHVWYFPFSVE
jgi:hypothetical protein